jgi:hypothetical protein
MFEHLVHTDETALVVLKGHLLIEESLEAIISDYVLHPEFVEKARLGFEKKMYLARSISIQAAG